MTKSKKLRSTKEEEEKNVCIQCRNKCMKIHGNESSPRQPPPTESAMPVSFFKIMLDDFAKILYLPPKCSSALQCMVDKHILVQDSYGLGWRVKVSSVNGSLAFVEGWQNFVLDHAIKFGELVVFKLLSKVTISAHVFATSACERHYYCQKSKRENQKNKYKKRRLLRHSSSMNKATSHTRDLEEEQIVSAEKSSLKEKAIVVADRQGSDTDSCSSSRLDVIDCNPVNMSPNLETSHQQLQLLPPADCLEVSSEMNIGLKEVGKDSATVLLNDDNLDNNNEPIRHNGCNNEQMICDEPSELEIANNEGLKLEIMLTSPSDILNSPKFQDKPCSSHDAVMSVQHSNKAESSKRRKISGGCKRVLQFDCNEAETNGQNEGKRASIEGQNKSINNPAASLNGPARRTRSHIKENLIAASTNSSKRKREKKSSKDKKNVSCLEDVGSVDEHMPILPMLLKDPEVDETHSVDKSKKAKNKKTTISEENTTEVNTETAVHVEKSSKGCNYNISTSVESHSWLVLPLRLPVKFRKLHCGRKVVLLQDPSMRLWPVLYHDSDKFVGFTSGWEDFTKANNVEQGDKCEVQLLNATESVLLVTFSKS